MKKTYNMCDVDKHEWGHWKPYTSTALNEGQVRTCKKCTYREYKCSNNFCMMLPPEEKTGVQK